MTRISIGIMAHIQREEWVNEMLQAIPEDDFGPVKVYYDREPLATSRDDKADRCWANARRVWADAHEGATHRLLLQDDIVLCGDFLEAVRKAINACARDGVLGLFTIRKAVEEAVKDGRQWVAAADGAWGQAICLPAKLLPSFLNFADRFCHKSQDDQRLMAYLHVTNRLVFTPVPTLIDHRDEGSLMGNSYPGGRRVSKNFVGEGVPVRSIRSLRAEPPGLPICPPKHGYAVKQIHPELRGEYEFLVRKAREVPQ